MGKRVLVFGTFDGIHSGHEFFLRSSRARGTELVVAVARDEHIMQFKGRKPSLSETRRLLEVQKLPFVDSAQLSDSEISSFRIVEDLAPDLVVLGHDQHDLESALLAWMAKSGYYVPMMRLKKV